jgi:Bacteriophage head to tail connecting protein
LKSPSADPTILHPSPTDEAYRRYVDGRLMGLRVNRYSWWTHWRELADFFLPRRYKWLITPNQMGRGSPINQHILDSTGCIQSRNLASGLVSGKSSPTSLWFRMRVGNIDSTKTGPVSLWLAEVERLLYLIFSESNFYNSIATLYYDLVVFGTGAMLAYEDFENVVNFINPCLGEYYVDIDSRYYPCIFYREFTMTVDAVVKEFGEDHVSPGVLQLYNDDSGANRTREIIVAHAIEPNDDGKAAQFGFSSRFKYREVYWEWGGSASPQGGAMPATGFLRRRGFYEQAAIIGRWDIVSNDPYGRSPGMDGLPDQKQIQVEQRRKAQAIDKMVNPPLVADIQLKNQPANLTPGGITFVTGYTASGKPGFASVYDTKFPVQEITADLLEVKQRLSQIFFNDVLKTASQYETRSNVTAVEWDLRKSESLVMLGPALERIDYEILRPVIDRVFAIANRAGIIPPPPAEIAGQAITIDFVSMLAQAQQAARAGSIERVLNLVGQLIGVDPQAGDKIDFDYAIDKYSSLLNNDPKMMRTDQEAAAIRNDRAKQQQRMAEADIAQKLSAGAKNLAGSDLGDGTNALQAMTGGGGAA